ncbi:hypothetical protein KIPB_013754, partial [Kipferlia bialata]|eukprot:g13754.t1
MSSVPSAASPLFQNIPLPHLTHSHAIASELDKYMKLMATMAAQTQRAKELANRD